MLITFIECTHDAPEVDDMVMLLRSRSWRWVGLTGWVATLAIACTAPAPLRFQAQGLSPATLQTLQHPFQWQDAAPAQAARQAGLAARDREDWSTAIAALEAAVAAEPGNVTNYVILGWTEHRSGDRAAAQRTLETAVSLAPEAVPALNALGIVYLVQGDLDAAIATHHQALTLKPENEIAHYNLSLAYHRQQDFAAAIRHAEQAAELEPGNPHPLMTLAIAQLSADNPAAASAAYQQAVRLDSRYTDDGFLDHLQAAGFHPDQIALVRRLSSSYPSTR